MAYVLSLRPHSPLKRSFSDSPYLQSCSPRKDAYLATLSNTTTRNASACSLYTFGSSKAGHTSQSNENTPPASPSQLNLLPESDNLPAYREPVDHVRRNRAYGIDRPSPFLAPIATPADPYSKKVQGSDAVVASVSSPSPSNDATSTNDHIMEEDELFGLYEAIRIPLPEAPPSDTDELAPQEHQPPLSTVELNLQPFRRWMSTLRKRHAQRRRAHEDYHPSPLDTIGESNGALLHPSRLQSSLRKTSDSLSSSIAGVTTVKTASITLAGTSIVPRSDAISTRIRLGHFRGSNFSETRKSVESYRGPLGPVVDESAWLRSLQRRKIVEELIASEEGYIADLKVLINDYFMILTALPALSGQTKTSIQQNISQILQLHEDLLAELHQIVPHADFTKSAHQETYPVTKAKHIRFHSADIIPGRLAEHKATRRLRHSLEIGRSPDKRPRGLVTDTETVGNIAKIFNRHMKRFFAYEEYGAHWTTMSQDLTTMCKGLNGWQEYERGIEALQKVIDSDNNRDAGSRKALSFSDLLIKPIQRVCKYPLLFGDLCRHTPVYDDPEAHAELEKALFRLQEAIREVNKAKDDPRTRRLIEITWLLQDRLIFQEQSVSRALVFRLLGHVLLCGVLHVAFQTPELRVKGQYMICVLYKSSLVLATSSRFQSTYTVVASIGLANSSVEEPSNGRGIQCHTAPHTWKLMFEFGHRLHEIIFSACSLPEEEVWKKQLRERSVCETHDFVEGPSPLQDMFSLLTLDIKSLGPVFGHTDSLVRRMSVHRAATLGAKPSMSQVIIKNTQAQTQKLPEIPPTFSPGIVARSQSHMSANHIPTLAPRRAERTRLETMLEDVWTKDILPYPGMSTRKAENQIRASANSVMRKLSMASIASNFSRRSPSFSSASNTRSEDSFGSRVHKKSQGNLRPRSATDRRPVPMVVDFHTAPAAFLPADFELEQAKPTTRRRRLVTRATNTDHPSETQTLTKPKRVRRLSTQLINTPRMEPSASVSARSTSQGSHTTIMRPAESVSIASCENGKQTRREARDCGSRDESTGVGSSKKFLKNRSRIFKFWM